MADMAADRSGTVHYSRSATALRTHSALGRSSDGSGRADRSDSRSDKVDFGPLVGMA